MRVVISNSIKLETYLDRCLSSIHYGPRAEPHVLQQCLMSPVILNIQVILVISLWVGSEVLTAVPMRSNVLLCHINYKDEKVLQSCHCTVAALQGIPNLVRACVINRLLQTTARLYRPTGSEVLYFNVVSFQAVK